MKAYTQEETQAIELLNSDLPNVLGELNNLLSMADNLPKHGGGFYGVPTIKERITYAINSLNTAIDQLSKM